MSHAIHLNPAVVRELESRISAIISNDYARLSQNSWWQHVAKPKTTQTKKEIFAWLIATAVIRDQGPSGGNTHFDNLLSHFTEAETRHAGSGLRLTRDQLTDVFNGEPGGEAFELAKSWSKDIAAYMAYWPQKKTAHFLKNGHTASEYTGYDGKAFFATDHPVNPQNDGMGAYKNLLTGGDAAPIDTGVPMDTAATNLAKVWAHVKSLVMPNGEGDPRYLTPKALIVPPKLFPRAKQLTSAEFIAMAASSGGGSADFRAFLQALGFAQPICADELSGFESETSYFVVCEQASNDELGAAFFLVREAFRLAMYGDMTEAALARLEALEWILKGRNSLCPGHPFLLFKVKAS